MKSGHWQFIGLAMALGAVGVLVRILVSEVLNKGGFPWGTLAVNAVGSLLIGLVIAIQSRSEPSVLWMAVAIGFLGALTTFSSFSLDGIKMISEARTGEMIIYVGVTNFICLAFCYLGTLGGRWLH